ncbi:MAG: CapA family protein [Patescibacteria group bacterium]|nr:CapA family protein [Patescibacteria group bacterium]
MINFKLLFSLLFILLFLINIPFDCWAKARPDNIRDRINILFAGDLMLDRYVKKKVEDKFGGNYFALFEKISSYLNSFDYVVVNLEGPISDKGKKVGSVYSFRMNPKVLDALKKANIKVYNLANNHIWDYGKTAFDDTLVNLSKDNLFYYGAGEKAYSPLIINNNGLKIGILGFGDFLTHLEAKNSKPGIAVINSTQFAKSIKEARKEVDILIVTFHWGNEYQAQPTSRQKQIARQAIDLGADLIIGHHPHVVQTIEKYKDKFIFYSLGNFIFDQSFSKDTMKGGLVEVEIEGTNIKNIYFRWSYLNRDFQLEKVSDRLLPYEINGKVYKLLIADEPEEWPRGLMFVKKPVDFDGMIFIFPDKQIRHFWNKNTFVDLDVYWLADEKIIGKDYLPSINKTKDIFSIKSPSLADRVIELIK